MGDAGGPADGSGATGGADESAKSLCVDAVDVTQVDDDVDLGFEHFSDDVTQFEGAVQIEVAIREDDDRVWTTLDTDHVSFLLWTGFLRMGIGLVTSKDELMVRSLDDSYISRVTVRHPRQVSSAAEILPRSALSGTMGQ
jgi:hypothetical protein